MTTCCPNGYGTSDNNMGNAPSGGGTAVGGGSSNNNGNSNNGSSSVVNGHTNAFIELNGIPYLVAEYVDKRTFNQVDRESIKSELLIDNSECMRTIIDISIDDIGKDSNGNLNVLGNMTKKANLITAIKNNSRMLHYKLPVLRRGIIVRVHYRLENQRTGMVIRSMVEDLRMYDRGYYLDINSDTFGDAAIVTNFSNSIVSTVAQFTHGLDPMILRITNIQLLYECVQPHPLVPRQTDSLVTDPNMVQYFYGCDADVYNAHMRLQHQHIFSSDSCGGNLIDDICPPTWEMFSRFYHFDNEKLDAVINDEEVYDCHTKLVNVPCGYIQVNRAFVINPGSRLIFKISIWKNDVIIVNDCTDIAAALGCPLNDNSNSGSGSGSVYPDCGCGDGTTNNTYPPSTDPGCNCNPSPGCQNLGDTLQQNCIDKKQNAAINKLGNKVDRLVNAIAKMHPDNTELNKLKYETNVHGDPVEALIERVEHLDRHLRKIEDKLDNSVDTEYIETLVNEAKSTIDDSNPPRYASVIIPADGDLSIVESNKIGKTNIYYSNRNMVYVDKNDPNSPSRDQSGWWAKVRITAPEGMNNEEDFVDTKVRVRRGEEGAWTDIDFWESQDSDKHIADCIRYILFCCHLDTAKLSEAVLRHEPLVFEFQADWNSNGTYENVIKVFINPSKVTLYDKNGEMVWPKIC